MYHEELTLNFRASSMELHLDTVPYRRGEYLLDSHTSRMSHSGDTQTYTRLNLDLGLFSSIHSSKFSRSLSFIATYEALVFDAVISTIHEPRDAT